MEHPSFLKMNFNQRPKQIFGTLYGHNVTVLKLGNLLSGLFARHIFFNFPYQCNEFVLVCWSNHINLKGTGRVVGRT